MLRGDEFVGAAARHGIRFYTGVPCSYLTPLMNAVLADSGLRYVAAANEAHAVAIAAGASLAGAPAVAMFQNSGLGNAINPLASLVQTFRIPVLLLTTLRGDPDGRADEPQHRLMGGITVPLFDLLGIPWAFLPTGADALDECLARAVRDMDRTNTPFAFVVREGVVEPVNAVPGGSRPDAPRTWSSAGPVGQPRFTRREMLLAIQSATADAAVIATTGYTGRELSACEDRPNQFYMVGSMGCAPSLGLGAALACPQRRVVVVDGDGALLMHMGALATIGSLRPPNFAHVLLDNGLYESTGGQDTVSPSVDFAAIAAACGYPHVHNVAAPDELARILSAESAELTFVYAAIRSGTTQPLPRPSLGPVDVADRFRGFLRGTCSH